MTTTVFLHIPKTAGQTVHAELSRITGDEHTSPIRVHTQAAKGSDQFPPGYRLYSGHLDWNALEALPEDRFVFTVLRDPFERIASFYLYLLKEARALTEEELETPDRRGMKHIRSHSADDYFLGGDAGWQKFIHDHYDNVYCTYFASQRMRGWQHVRKLSVNAKVAAALEKVPLVDRIYSTLDLASLERDVALRLGETISVADRFVNIGDHPREDRRWPKLVERLESDASIRRLEKFAEADIQLLDALGLEI